MQLAKKQSITYCRSDSHSVEYVNTALDTVMKIFRLRYPGETISQFGISHPFNPPKHSPNWIDRVPRAHLYKRNGR